MFTIYYANTRNDPKNCRYPNRLADLSDEALKEAFSHDYVCAEVSKGVASVGLETGIPVIFGVLTTDNIEQAIERAGTKSGNKGSDAAKSAIEMVSLITKIG